MQLGWLTEAAWLDRQRVLAWAKLALAPFLISSLIWVAMGDGVLDSRGEPFGTDFVSFWSASSLAVEGAPEAAYDQAMHRAAEREALGGAEASYYAFYYPPMFLALVLPLALLPYGPALLAWLVASFAAYMAVMRRIVPHREALWVAAAFPAVFVNAGHGQNGFLTAALFGGAMILLIGGRPLVAGLLIGCLTVKPQLGLLIPFALLAGGYWRTFLAAAAASMGIAAATVAIFGFDTWRAFLDATPMATLLLEQGDLGWAFMQSAFAATRLAGGGVGIAYGIQGMVTLAALAAVIWTWRGPAPLALKAAVLAAATPLATPFVLDYDLMILALPIAWLAVEGMRTGFLSCERIVLLAAWMLPLFSRLAGTGLGVSPGPFVLGALLFVLLRRIDVMHAAHAAVRQPVHPAAAG